MFNGLVMQKIKDGNSLIRKMKDFRHEVDFVDLSEWKSESLAALRSETEDENICNGFIKVLENVNQSYGYYEEQFINKGIEYLDKYSRYKIQEDGTKKQDKSKFKNKIFIVHGHDETVKQTVARFLQAIHLEPVILHEKANNGATIIEKFEKNADVAFAVVLMTPDDVGGKDNGSLKLRARQNVVAELGYFVGKLGRNRVAALVKGDVEIPSDFDGVVYTTLDDHGAWKMKLANELEEAGLEIDFKKVAKA